MNAVHGSRPGFKTCADQSFHFLLIRQSAKRSEIPGRYVPLGFDLDRGVISQDKVHFKSGIPCLGGLPIIGAAFSENDRANHKDNIIIFVRPHIVNSFEDYRQLTERQEMLYKDQAVLPILKEQFDEGIDMVKTPENE